MIKKILITSKDLTLLNNFPKEDVYIEYIKHFRREPPDQFRVSTKLACFYWIMVMKRSLPLYLQINPLETTERGNTPAMLWIEHCGSNPPKWMRHNPIRKNGFGKTCLLLWYYYSNQKPPEWMKYSFEKTLENTLEKKLAENEKDFLTELIDSAISDYSEIKYYDNSIDQFITLNRILLKKGIKAKFIYDFYKTMCLRQHYSIENEETFHERMREKIFYIFDEFDNIVYKN
jgi:hypothetical protein